MAGYTFKEVQGTPTGSFTAQDQTVTYVYTKNPVADGNGTGDTGSTQSGNPSATVRVKKILVLTNSTIQVN
nr:MucBP domain-containing protein [Lactiplantibacillus plantarum]